MNQDQEGLAEQAYFVPPPLNELNKLYYQQFSNEDDPVHHSTKFYMSYNQLFKIDQKDDILQVQMATTQLTKSLKDMNRSLYVKMVQCLTFLSGYGPLEQMTSMVQSIKQEIAKFMQICQSIKGYECRKGVCEIIRKETAKIKERTKQILLELQKVKANLSNSVQECERVTISQK